MTTTETMRARFEAWLYLRQTKWVPQALDGTELELIFDVWVAAQTDLIEQMELVDMNAYFKDRIFPLYKLPEGVQK